MMENRGQIALGAGMIALGLLFLLGIVLQINIWAVCFPVGLIGLGALLLLRPRFFSTTGEQSVVLLGETRRRGEWQVRDEEFWMGIGDLDLDFTEAQIPPGETRLRVFNFVGSIDILLPHAAGMRLHAFGFVLDGALNGLSQDRFFSSLDWATDNIDTAENCLVLELTGFVSEIKVRRF